MLTHCKSGAKIEVFSELQNKKHSKQQWNNQLKNKKNVTFASFHLYIISIIYHEKDNRMHFHHLLYIIML